MMTKNYLLAAIGVSIILTSVLSSCGTTDKVISGNFIQKRKYNKGWYVNFLTKTPKTKAITNDSEFVAESLESSNSEHQAHITDEESINQEQELNFDDITASVDNSVIPIQKNTPVLFPKKGGKTQEKQEDFEDAEECDVIILKNGQEIKAKVLEVGTNEIKYKMCDNLEGPTFSKKKSEVFKIQYPNGSSTVISSIDDNSRNDNTSSTSDSSDKSQLVALLLCIFLGGLGIHRFYLGHIGMGVLYLLTAGLCGIGWLIDIILILTGGLKPKDGEYKDKL